MDEIEEAWLAQLLEPTVEEIRRDKIKADILLQQVGRAIAPQVNAALADLAKKAEKD